MSLCLAILHGEQVLFGLVFAAIITIVGVPLLLYIWLWHTKVSALKLAVGYFVLAALLCAVFASTNVVTSIPSLIASSFGFILTLPWNVLVGFGLSDLFNVELSDREIAAVMLFGAAVNAVLLYFAARKMRRLIE